MTSFFLVFCTVILLYSIMKQWFVQILVICVAGFTPLGVFANTWETAPESKTLYFSVFTRENCVHCIELKTFLGKHFWTGSSVQPKYYEIDIPEQKNLFNDFTTKNNLSKITPIILVGNEVFEWYQSDDTTGQRILELTKTLEKSSYFESFSWDIKTGVAGIWCGDDGASCSPTELWLLTSYQSQKSQLNIKLPFFGVVDMKQYSLFFLAAILGFIDGFNPCAMWVLIMFLSILMQSGSRKKMMQIAWTFIFAETIMYFLILNVWYKTWDFVQLDSIVTPIIGVLSVGAGAYFIYEFFTNKDGECKVTSVDQKRAITQRIKNIVTAPMSFGVFLATIGIAFSVNIIEFACSIGIPQAFTKLLEMSNLQFMEKQMYVLLYSLFYMIDDFIVFGVAIYAFQYLHLTTKYTRYCLVIWGVIMMILWYFFIFNPSALKLLIA